MSLPCQIEVTCRSCGNKQSLTFWQTLNASLNPEAKAALLDGSLHRFRCAHCGAEDEVLYPILYHDPHVPTMIWLVLDPSYTTAKSLLRGPFTRNYHFRFVTSWKQMVEKIHIFECKLDDRVEELLKFQGRRDAAVRQARPLAGELWFMGLATENSSEEMLAFALTTGTGEEIYSVERSQFDNLERALANRLPPLHSLGSEWMCVDETYVAQLASGGN
ncbi:MAG TPA: CpXC domain-containing protein [Verrucomicrobiota bacterium]|nr:CpXC domain-containing protein [Verrucomicrobiota bacterium]HNT15268.1 CpXC domain-containing protein [Verrucomicrobiota bacterium]